MGTPFTTEQTMTTLAADRTFVFDARGVAKRFRHAAIFGALESLNEGETMRFVNDHDPLPLLQQIGERYRQQVRVAYVARQPDQVVIDFSVHPERATETTGGCGGTGGGCGCSGS
jgi:uncharacterized protein (DUF2249 family)